MLVLLVWLKFIFTQKGTNSKTLLCHMFRLNTLKDTAKILTVVTLDFSALCGTSQQIFSPKRYDDVPRYFYMGVPHGTTMFIFN